MHVIILFSFIVDIMARDIPIKINSGAYIQRLPNMTFYETNVPLLIELVYLPSSTWSSCRQHVENADLYRKYFPAFGFFYNVLSFSDLEPGAPIEGLVHDDGDMWAFPLVTRTHVKDFLMSDEEAESIVGQLEKTMKKHRLYHPNISQDNVNQCNSTMAEKLVQIQAVLEEQKRQQIMEMCRSKKLDPSIMEMSQLKTLLKEIKFIGTTQGHTLALDHIRTYYARPLVECIISPKKVFFGIHVPLIREELQGLSLRRIMTPSFAWYDKTCSLNLEVVDLAVKRDGTMVTTKLPRCDPFRDELCLITDIFNKNLKDELCAKLIIQGAAMVDFIKMCPLQCKETGIRISHINALSNNRFLVTHPAHSINITCEKRSWSYQVMQDIGLIEVEIPCGCIMHHGDQSIRTGHICRSVIKEPTAKLVLPAAWSSVGSIQIPAYDEKSPEFTDLEGCLNTNWYHTDSNYLFILNIISIILCFLAILVIALLLRALWRRPTPAACQHSWIKMRSMANVGRPPQPLPRPTSVSTVTDDYGSSGGYVTPTPRIGPSPAADAITPQSTSIPFGVQTQPSRSDPSCDVPKEYHGSTITLHDTMVNLVKNPHGYVIMERRWNNN